MTTKQMIKYYGSITAAAKALNITHEAVRQWVTAGSIPVARQYQLQVLTDGALRVRGKGKARAAG